MTVTRRELIKWFVGSQMLGLRALASGIPPRILQDPRRALSTDTTSAAGQFLLLSTSQGGDPINCNVPGTYEISGPRHSQDPAMAPTSISLGGATYQAAKPWASLPTSVLSRLCFFHNATSTVVHGDERKVLTLNGRAGVSDMLTSLISSAAAVNLQTLSSRPVSLSTNVSESLVSHDGMPLPQLPPTALKAMLGQSHSALQNLEALRARDLDSLNTFFKAQNPGPRANFIDQFATSQQQARMLSQQVPEALNNISDNGPNGQIIAAVILFQMRLVPAVSISIPFGGDNHADPDLLAETSQTITGAASIAFLMEQLQSVALQDQVTFATLNVFGRTLGGHNGVGRGHNDLHQCSLLLGKGVKPCVIGGIASSPANNDFAALPIDSTTGAGTQTGDIGVAESLAAFGATLGAAMGLDLQQALATKVVRAALI